VFDFMINKNDWINIVFFFKKNIIFNTVFFKSGIKRRPLIAFLEARALLMLYL
jgi:hypothetical protein